MGKLEQNEHVQEREENEQKMKGNKIQCDILCWILEDKKDISGKMVKSN